MTLSLRGSVLGFVGSLSRHADATALVSGPEQISYATLAARVADVAARLGDPEQDGPKVCVVPLDRSVGAVVGYLGVLAAGHVAAVVAPGQEGTLTDFAPDVVMAGERIEVLRSAGGAAAPHPELALLLSTSGTTGSSKLVRLGRAGVQHNADAIAGGLGLRADDCAISSLPLHYCYGLSVLHSHLAVGARMVLTDAQVAEEEFWDLVGQHRVTTIAGVPHSYAMMLRTGLAQRALPSVRRFTVAGGGLAPEQVREVAAIGARGGWDLHVMYGQTEATARMSMLPPDDLVEAPGSVGPALPGGIFEIDQQVPEAAGLGRGVGEVVYRGPNVMLGYATSRWDLVGGRDVDALRTGDLGYLDGAGRLHLVGRRSGFVKIVGKRVDLARVESIVREHADDACVTGDDERIDISYVTERALRPDEVVDLVVGRTGLPRRAVRAVAAPTLPRLSSGKVDRRAVAELARRDTAAPDATTTATGRTTTGRTAGRRTAVGRRSVSGRRAGAASLLERVLSEYRECLDRPDADPQSSFVSLGGDSLSFVELSVRLESIIGDLPSGWPQTPIAELVALAEPPRAWAAVDTSVLLRAAAALTILGTHIGLFTLLGGAHLLLAVLGFNAARFSLASRTHESARRLTRSAAGIAIPTVIWVLGTTLLLDAYRWPNLLLVNWFAGEPRWDSTDQLWFIETAVWSLLLLAAVFRVKRVRDWYAERPTLVVGALLAVALVPRFVVLPFVDGPVRGFLPFAFWLVALGMAAAHARTNRQRIVLSIVAVAASAGFYGLPGRETYIVLGILALLWLPTVRVPRAVLPVLTPLAGASLYIYLVQWQVFPHIANPLLAFALSLIAGTAVWYLAEAAQRRGRGLLRSATRESKDPNETSRRRHRRRALAARDRMRGIRNR